MKKGWQISFQRWLNNNGQSFLCIFSVDSPKLIFFPQINLLIRLFNYPIVWGYLLITAECYIKHCCYRLLFNDLNWCCVYTGTSNEILSIGTSLGRVSQLLNYLPKYSWEWDTSIASISISIFERSLSAHNIEQSLFFLNIKLSHIVLQL